MKTYKVLSIISLPDELLKPTEIEEKISEVTKDGWKLVSSSDNNIQHKGKEINRILLYFEKDK